MKKGDGRELALKKGKNVVFEVERAVEFGEFPLTIFLDKTLLWQLSY